MQNSKYAFTVLDAGPILEKIFSRNFSKLYNFFEIYGKRISRNINKFGKIRENWYFCKFQLNFLLAVNHFASKSTADGRVVVSETHFRVIEIVFYGAQNYISRWSLMISLLLKIFSKYFSLQIFHIFWKLLNFQFLAQNDRLRRHFTSDVNRAVPNFKEFFF